MQVSEYQQVQHTAPNMMQLHREINNLFEDALRGFSGLSRTPLWGQMNSDNVISSFRANVNVASDDNQYLITLEAPGLERKDLTIELKDRMLSIRGNKQQEHEEKEKHFYRVERHYGSFERLLAIPDDAVADEISASMKNGVLTITIPRKAFPKSEVKQIEIGSD